MEKVKQDGVYKSVCPLDCPDQCGLLIHKKEGRIEKIEGDPDHPVTQGAICNKVRNMKERLYDEKRLTHPLRRTGKKGEGAFERITWSEAIEEITQRWKKLIETEGPQSILPYSFYGNMGNLSAEGMGHRFFHYMGASRLERTICSTAGGVGYNYTMGSSIGTDPEDTEDAKLIIFWGINAVSTNMHQITQAQKARKKGAKVVVIDVHKNQTGRFADWFIPIKPGTDAALALGMMHILFAEDLVDHAFMKKYTVGRDELKQEAASYTPEVVSAITGVSQKDLYELTRMYGRVEPAFIRIGNGIQHHDNGGMCVRTIACLPALTGQWLKKGGGAIKGNSAVLAFNTTAMQRPDLLADKRTRAINMNQIGEALLTKKEPAVRSMYVYNSNPALVAPETNKVHQGLAREDLFLVVHDMFATETARYADIVLPAASSFESTDFYTSYWHHYVQMQQPVMEPYGESKNNAEVFRLLAEAMAFDEPALYEDDEEMIAQAFRNTGNKSAAHVTLGGLKQDHYIKAHRSDDWLEHLATPSGKIELFSEKMEKAGFSGVPTYQPLPDVEGDFLFIPAPNHHFLNSTFAHNAKHTKLEKKPKAFLNEEDANVLGIQNDDMVRLYNARGECRLPASVGDTVLSGVVVTQGLWADEPGMARRVNDLTPDRLADMGGGATFFSGRVHVEKAKI
ncbi:anaerobic selenocysteine-containing dehydrogenase [Sinobaca qinghaiensis]|uniref:Anaerobic selenocysteine-containing dehydrogenase n=1 Tax=Sinobaca qinghaiensis TaxID=342944 RepID=A0A419V4Y9_9BACL|nr:molybdopterin-dependent oxidoreductase [Sinobaca qinghaiensis]RKD73492.1 anaerobic selenocysteine-containing dehydrogenase [Sinobaca qinghaiensis]